MNGFLDRDALVSLLLSSVKRGYSIAVQAYPGWGKTRVAAEIAQLYPGRVVVVTRSHEEIYEIMMFMGGRGAAYGYGRPSICPLMSRDSFRYELCKFYRETGRCQYRVEPGLVKWLSLYRSPREVREKASETGTCLYPSLRALVKGSRVAVVTYHYLLANSFAGEKRDLYIYDEVHTVFRIIAESVYTYNEASVLRDFKLLKAHGEHRMAYALRSLYRKSSGNLRVFIDALERTGLADYLPGYTETYSFYMAYRRKRAICRGDVCHYLPADYVHRLLEYKPRIELSAFLPFFSKSYNDVIVDIEPPDNPQEVVIDTSITTRYTERDQAIYDHLVEAVSKYISRDCGNMVVAVSKDMARELSARLKHAQEATGEIRAVPPGGVIVTHAWSPLTEGVNIDGLCRVIVAGMPYPPPDPGLTLLSRIHGFDNTFTYLALLASLQAIGRLRFRGLGILLDRRFADRLDDLPPWIRVKAVVG